MPVRGLAAIISGAFVLGLAAVPAPAAALTASNILGEFDAVVFHDVSGGCCDFEGPMEIGGYLSGGGSFFNKSAAALPADYGIANVYVNVSGQFNANGAQVYISGRDFASFSLDVNAASTVVVNVSGNYTQQAKIRNIVEADRTKVIWNFYDAAILNLTQFGGVVLAPYATVHNSSPIEGTLIARAFNPGGELHYHPFTGDLSSLKLTDVAAPAGTAMLGVGLLGLLGLRLAGQRR